MRQFLDNHRGHTRAVAKIAGNEAAAANVDPGAAGPATPAPNGGGQDESESDVSISDTAGD